MSKRIRPIIWNTWGQGGPPHGAPPDGATRWADDGTTIDEWSTSQISHPSMEIFQKVLDNYPQADTVMWDGSSKSRLLLLRKGGSVIGYIDLQEGGNV